MRRREFIAGLGAAAASPLPVCGQQAPKQVPRVGVLIGFAEQDPATQRLVAAFVKSLGDLGWAVDRDVSIELRYGGGNSEKNRALAKELVALKPDVIFVNSTSATLAVQGATSTVRVVFATVSDPVGSGIVASLARIPVVSGVSRSGSLLSYAPNTEDPFQRSGAYVDKILRGARPGDLPVQLPTKFDLIINLRTAKALGLKVPQTIIAEADERIE
jgi:ABC-type uncharacterized transport system substrate-binding protein